MSRTVVIDCFPSSLHRYRYGWTVVAVDTIRATTTAVTALAQGRAVHPVTSVAQAHEVAHGLPDPLLTGEQGGVEIPGFEENNSPAAVHARDDVQRPMVLLSSTGTALFHERGPREALYAACLRNVSATVEALDERHQRVAVVGAGTRGEFREEDAYVCARVADGLLARGYRAGQRTQAVLTRWQGLPPEAFCGSRSVDYLRRSGQLRDLDFILAHDDDLDLVAHVDGRQLVVDPDRAPAVPALEGLR